MILPATTNPCGSGTAHPLPGFSLSVFAGAPAIEALLTKDVPRGAAALIAGVIGGATWGLTSICSANPPDDPVLTQSDFDALNFPEDIVPYLNAVNRFKDAFVRLAWVNWCGCDNGTIPSYLTITPPPDQQQNPGLPSGTSGTSCWFGSQQVLSTLSGTVNFDGTILMWQENPQVFVPSTTDRTLPQPLPTLVQVHQKYFPNAGDNVGVRPSIAYFDVHGALISATPSGPFPNPTEATVSLAPPAGAVSCNISLTLGENATPVQAGGACLAEVTMWCVGQTPGTPDSPCCPPDPSVDSRLNAILQIVSSLAGSAVPPADTLRPGTAHSNLSGNGSVLLTAECAAILVHVHQPIPALGVNPGTPDYYFSMGFITSYAVGSPLKGWRLVYTDQIFPMQTYADQVGFTLPPGITVDITEMLPATAAG